MHMLVMTMVGLIVLAACVFGAQAPNRRAAGRTVNGPLVFIWLWLAIAFGNFLVGVFEAGYSFATEFAVHAVIFGVPAGLAWSLSRRIAHGGPDAAGVR